MFSARPLGVAIAWQPARDIEFFCFFSSEKKTFLPAFHLPGHAHV
jgi:hypothetical protein